MADDATPISMTESARHIGFLPRGASRSEPGMPAVVTPWGDRFSRYGGIERLVSGGRTLSEDKHERGFIMRYLVHCILAGSLLLTTAPRAFGACELTAAELKTRRDGYDAACANPAI